MVALKLLFKCLLIHCPASSLAGNDYVTVKSGGVSVNQGLSLVLARRVAENSSYSRFTIMLYMK